MINNNLIIFILFIFVVIFVFLCGYNYSKNKQNKTNNKIQNKINSKLKINNKDELIKKLKKNLFIIILLLTSCYSSNKITIPLQEYTKYEQENLINFLNINDNQLINKLIIDYYNLRELVKIYNNL